MLDVHWVQVVLVLSLRVQHAGSARQHHGTFSTAPQHLRHDEHRLHPHVKFLSEIFKNSSAKSSICDAKSFTRPVYAL